MSCTLLSPERNYQMKHTIPTLECRDLLREVAINTYLTEVLKAFHLILLNLKLLILCNVVISVTS